ncbi:S8 family serine peptidase [Streptomyces sp. NPDC089919]|uniref:S8 family serine peptidase n=1 Tax=Streptomyces sp. NPDC089919 TaxID=3155188 RepID=UPI003420D7D3
MLTQVKRSPRLRMSRPVGAVTGALALCALVAAAPSPAAAPPGRATGYVVVLKDTAADPGTEAARLSRRNATGSTVTAVYRHALRGYAARLTAADAERLRADPAVRLVSPQRTYRAVPPAHRTPAGPVPCGSTTPGQCLPQWADRIDAERSSARSGDGRGSVTGVNVAVMDSGIDGTHPDLNVRGGADCLGGTPVVPGDSLVVGDPHGTEVGGVIAARDDGHGIVGVAPGAPLWAVKVFPDDETGESDDAVLLCGLDWVVSTRTDQDPGNDIHVVNMSLTTTEDGRADTDDGACGTVDGDTFHLAVCAAARAGVTVIAGAGNDNVDLARRAPAAYQEVLTATAMTDFDGRPGAKSPSDCYGSDYAFFGEQDDQATLEFSNFVRNRADRLHTVSAPGVCVLTTTSEPAGSYAAVDGTSFASPVAAGTAVLCLAYGPCDPATPLRTVRTLTEDARRHQHAHPAYGFEGDDRSPFPGRHYGPLVHAADY